MKRLVLAALLLAALVPASSRAGACSPLNCSPSQFALGNGSLLGVRGAVNSPVRVLDLRTGKTLWRLPGGIVAGRARAYLREVTYFNLVPTPDLLGV